MPKVTIAVIEGIARGGGSEFALAFGMRFAALGKARLASFPLDVIARAKRAVVAAIGDLGPGLRIEDQLFRESMAGPSAAEGMAAFMSRGGQTREYELGDNPL